MYLRPKDLKAVTKLKPKLCPGLRGPHGKCVLDPKHLVAESRTFTKLWIFRAYNV